MPLNFIML